jgi:hypothetical protein
MFVHPFALIQSLMWLKAKFPKYNPFSGYVSNLVGEVASLVSFCGNLIKPTWMEWNECIGLDRH